MSKKAEAKPSLMFKNNQHELVNILQPIHSDVIVFSADCSTFRFEGSNFGLPDSLKNAVFLSDGSTQEEIIARIKAHNETFSKERTTQHLEEYKEATKLFQEEVLKPIKELIESYKKQNV